MYVSSQKNSRCYFAQFLIFWYDKKGEIQFLPKIAKVANNKSFLFPLKMFTKDIQNGDKGCMFSQNKIHDVVFPYL